MGGIATSGYASALVEALRGSEGFDAARYEAAIAEGAQRGLRPMRALLAIGLSIETLELAAWAHKGYELVDLHEEDVDLAVLEGFPLAIARRLHAMPIRFEYDTVVVAMVDPTQLLAVDEVQRLFAGKRIRYVVAPRDRILELIDSIEMRQRVERVAEEQAEVAAAMEEDLEDLLDTSVLADGDQLSEGRIARLVKSLMERAATMRASDVHLEPNGADLVVRFRIDGVLHIVNTYPMMQAPAIINRVKVMAGLDVGERRLPQDGRFDVRLGDRRIDIRLVTLPTSWGVEGAVMRLLEQTKQVATLESLGYSQHVLDTYLPLIEAPHGAVLATGPTGSGKTTTLYASLARIATTDRKVLTVEDPVEYRFPGITQVQVNDKAGLSFPRALRAFLRADPDIVLVGELRDQETAQVGIQAALTGHLVLATVHANSAVSVATRLIDIGIEPFLVASALKGAIAQRLVRKLCANCREEYRPAPESLASLPWPGDIPEVLCKAHEGGCARCDRTGYAGRFAIAEVFTIDEDIASAVATRISANELQMLANQRGMVSMFTDGLAKVGQGVTSLEELSRVVI